MTLLFGDLFAKDVSGRGNKINLITILDTVDDIRRHMNEKKRIKGTYPYGDNEFYYLAYLASYCKTYLNLIIDPMRTKAIMEIQDILKPFTQADRQKITEIAINKMVSEERIITPALLDELDTFLNKPA